MTSRCRTPERMTKKKERKPDTDQMSFWDHLDVLRGTIIRSLVWLCAFTALGLAFRDPLFDIVLAPTRQGFVVYRLLGWDFSMDLINIEISAQFFVHLRAAVGAGLVLSFPFIIWEIWRFIRPALYEGETRAVRAAFLLSSILFYIGVVFGYLVVLPICLQFFVNYTVSPEVVNSFTLGSYMNMFTSMVLLIGIAFEFPAVLSVLSRIGVLNRGMLRKGRRYAVVVVMILAALITPSDPFSMMVLALPLYALYELGILLSKPETAETE